MKPLLIYFLHPCILDSGNPCRNDGDINCVDTYALRERAFKKAQIVTVRSINTHTWVNWILLGRDALKPAIASAIENADRVVVSAISGLE